MCQVCASEHKLPPPQTRQFAEAMAAILANSSDPQNQNSSERTGACSIPSMDSSSGPGGTLLRSSYTVLPPFFSNPSTLATPVPRHYTDQDRNAMGLWCL